MREPNSHLAQARERKEAFLPEIARLSLEGHTSREVAEKVGIPKTTVRRTLNLFKDKLLYVDAILDHIVLDQLVRKTLLFCEEKKPDFVGIEAEQFQEMRNDLDFGPHRAGPRRRRPPQVSAAWMSTYECFAGPRSSSGLRSTCSLIGTPQFEAVPTPFDAATEVDLFFPLT